MVWIVYDGQEPVHSHRSLVVQLCANNRAGLPHQFVQACYVPFLEATPPPSTQLCTWGRLLPQTGRSFFWGSMDSSVLSCTEPLCWQSSPAYHPTEHPGICACGLGGIEKQVVGVTPRDKVLDQFPVLLLSTSGAAHNQCVVCKLLYMTELWVVLEVLGVVPPSTPQSPQSYMLRSSSPMVCNPGVWFYSQPWQFVPGEQWLNGVKGYNHCTRGQTHPGHQYWKTKPNSMNC